MIMRIKIGLLLALLSLVCRSVQGQEKAVSLEIRPASVVLMPQLPDSLHILSINNSLIAFCRQNELFDQMMSEAGYHSRWTAHSIIGGNLKSHWDEGELLNANGEPGAKMLVRSYPWTHIILQDMSIRPTNYFDRFLGDVTKWVDFIRSECPNPNVVIIMPMNWAKTQEFAQIDSITDIMRSAYQEVARQTGVTICPVGESYRQLYHAEGDSIAQLLYMDNLHPSGLGGYMAAAMEMSVITGVTPNQITWCPDSIDSQQADMVKDYATRVMRSYNNVVDQQKGIVRYQCRLLDAEGNPVSSDEPISYSLSGGGTMLNSNFHSNRTLGSYELVARCGELSATGTIQVAEPSVKEQPEIPSIVVDRQMNGVSENFNSMGTGTTLPVGWRVDMQYRALRYPGYYSMAQDEVAYVGGQNISPNEKGFSANFGASDNRDDRSVGGLVTSRSNAPVGVNIYAHIVNRSFTTLYHLALSYDVEKYRNGSLTAGTSIRLFYSTDGCTWTAAGNQFNSSWLPDDDNEGSAVVPMEKRNVAHHLHGLEIPPGGHFYLAWNVGPSSGQSASRTMALGIDNVSFTFNRRTTGVKHPFLEDDAMLKLSGSTITGSGAIIVCDIHGRIVASGRQIVNIDGLSRGVYVARDESGAVFKFFL